MTTISATPAKLRSGEWGARVQGAARAGDILRIVAKSGKTWDARVVKVVWSGEGATLCATESLDRTAASPPRYSRSSGAGSAAPVRGYSSWCTDRPGCGCYDCAS